METINFRGTGVALITPFDAKRRVDFKALKNLLQYTENHVDYFVVLGTTGESATLTKTEKKEVLAFVKKNNPTKKPIVYGLGGNDTQAVLEEADSIDFEGVSAILSVSPYYNRPSQQGIFKHYEALAEQLPRPIILYNVPSRTASNLLATTILALAQHKNIIGIKEASGDLIQAMRIAKDKPADFMLISGDDMLTVPMIATGATGVISVLANAFPMSFCTMVNFALKGNFEQASQLLFKFLKINDLMYVESNPTGVKQALVFQKVCKNFVRLPLTEASEALKKEMKAAMGLV